MEVTPKPMSEHEHDDGEIHDWLAAAIEAALEQGRDVELVLCDDYGFTPAIDGEPLFDRDHGMPWETFEYSIEDIAFSEGVREVLEEVYEADE